MEDFITFCGLIGMAATMYAIYVEKRSSRNRDYVAMCDINDAVSCSAVLKSPYAKLAGRWLGLDKNSMFNVPNTYYGFLFYFAVVMYGVYPFTLIPFREYMLFAAAAASLFASGMLAFILYVKIKSACLICIFTWFVNAAIYAAAWNELWPLFPV